MKKLLGLTLIVIPVLAYFGSAAYFGGWLLLLQLLGAWALVGMAVSMIVAGVKLIGK